MKDLVSDMNASPRSFVTFAVLITFAFALAARSQDLPPAPGKIVQSLTAAPGYFTEPGVAVNPRNPQQVVAVFHDNAHASYSVNGGGGWNRPHVGAAPA